MRILFVSNLYEPYSRGGAEVVVKRSIEAAKALGHEVTLLTARPWRSGARFGVKKTLEQGVTVYSYYPGNFFFYADDYLWPFFARLLWHAADVLNYHTARIMRSVLRQAAPDLVITHNLIGLGYTIPKQIRQARLHHIHVLHDIQLAVRSGIMLAGQEHRWDSDGLPARLYQALVRRQFASPDLVVSPSQFLLDFYNKLGYFPKSRKHVLQNPIDSRFYGIKREPSFGPFRLLFVGQLVRHKGIDVLKEAFDAVSLADPGKYTLDIVGDGPMFADVREWAKDRKDVQLHGRLPNERLAERYASADLLLMPTLTYENSPSVVFEALASGTPVAVSTIGGAAEAVQDGKNGFTVAPKDARAWIAAIKSAAAAGNHLRLGAGKSVEGLDSASYMRRLLSAATAIQKNDM